MKKSILLFFSLLSMSNGFSSIKINGVYYNLNSTDKTAEVTQGLDKYAGIINIPQSINYNNVSYRVVSIDNTAFQFSTALTSITIPSSVTNIEIGSFTGCI